ncbi:nucleoside hydrolase [Massilia niastensis]|uniref:nucleoside hydrolase n=1 Tax=Massilia niastensis TaxID=544911 RepID=UPI001B7FCD0B|nr:nucleoside hydrolase [Massilia niastensis]
MISRRNLVRGAALAACSALVPVTLHAAPYRRIPQRPAARVIVDNDFAGDPDALVALAHQLLAPRTKTMLITSSALDPKLAGDAPAGRTAAAGRDIAIELLRRAEFQSAPPVVTGSETFGDGAEQVSPAARAIVAEAMRDDPLPLYITCGGALTNIAAALRLQPGIARRMTLIWIGGGSIRLEAGNTTWRPMRPPPGRSSSVRRFHSGRSRRMSTASCNSRWLKCAPGCGRFRRSARGCTNASPILRTSSTSAAPGRWATAPRCC